MYKSPKVLNPYIPIKLQLNDGVQGVRNVLLLMLILKKITMSNFQKLEEFSNKIAIRCPHQEYTSSVYLVRG